MVFKGCHGFGDTKRLIQKGKPFTSLNQLFCMVFHGLGSKNFDSERYTVYLSGSMFFTAFHGFGCKSLIHRDKAFIFRNQWFSIVFMDLGIKTLDSDR